MLRTRTCIIFLSTLPALAACASGKAPAHADAGVAMEAPTDSGGSSATFSYSPAGCMYEVSPPASRGYLDVALDDTAAVDATSGTPERVRLGLGGNTTAGQPGYPDPTTTAVFAWETAGANHAAKVKLGSSATALGDVHAGYAWTTPAPTVGVGNNEPATYMHEVHVCGLAPDKTYYYQVGGGAAGQEIWSATQSFTTLPTTGSVTIGISGDARDVASTWQLVHERMRDAGVALQLFSGDVVDIGTDESLYTTWLNDIWKDPTDPTKFLTLGQMMFLPIAGNHENEAVRFYSAFSIPGDGPYAKTFNSFNIGSAHVVMLDDTFVSLSPPPPEAVTQLQWLAQDLAAAEADRAAHPFIIVVSHRGLFSTSNHAADPDVLTARGALAPLYDKYHVDLVFNGHDHEYERSKPLNAGTPPSGAPVVPASPAPGTATTYVICAGAGADPYVIGTAPSPYRQTNATFGPGTPYLGAYGFLKIDANMLTFTAYGLKGAGGADDVLDMVQLSH